MQIQPTNIPDVWLIEPRVFRDDRGFFKETYRAAAFAEAGITAPFVQDNHSGSQQGILRGLHYQLRHAQGKLLWVLAGEIYDVAVDVRRGSPTFGKWVSVNLTAESHQQLWIPPGFAHGFYVVSDWAEVVYKVTEVYAPEWERTILWNDPDLNIPWPIVEGKLILSAKDQKGKPLKEAEVYE
jgi:dTDP-4-dehydrorhamnose 3,5-epimerase